MNDQMYKLGFELALQQAGIKEAGMLGDAGKYLWEQTPNLRNAGKYLWEHTPNLRNAGKYLWEQTPNLRNAVGLGSHEMGHNVMNPNMAKNLSRKYKGMNQTMARNRPALQNNLAAQPKGAYATR